MKKISIGLDIGIASVGWCITDAETLDIIKHGVRLFDTVDDKKDGKLLNEDRRAARSMRRQINRRKTLKRDFIKFLIDQGMVTDIVFDRQGQFVETFRQKYLQNHDFLQKLDNNDGLAVFRLRQKGLTKPLEKMELIHVLYWYINHRGFKYTIASEGKDKKDDKTLSEEDKKIKQESKFPVEAQINYFKEHNYLNGTFNREFHADDYTKEITQIFTNQKLTEAFETRFKELFTRQRSFEIGPGNCKTPSPYGLWARNEQTGEVYQKYDNIWEKTVGHCSVYPEAFRAPKNSLSAELFNLLNDLNNCYLPFGKEKPKKLETPFKKELMKLAFEYRNCGEKIRKAIVKEYKLEDGAEDQIQGFRVKGNKKDKIAILITSLESIHDINACIGRNVTFDEIFPDGHYDENNFVDKIIAVFFQHKTVEARKKGIEALKLGFNEEVIEKLSQVKGGYSQTHSLSLKALRVFIPELINTEHNQEQIRSAMNLQAKTIADFTDQGWIEETITTPTVKRSLRQSMNVLNAIFKLCQEQGLAIDDIVIEMAKEANNKDERERIQNYQKYREEIRENLKGFVTEGMSNTTIDKLWLREQQKGRDAYTGEEITADEICNNPKNFDIDHVIPYTQSYDNSRDNKVLTRSKNNRDKGNKTPKRWMSATEFSRMEKYWQEWYGQGREYPFKSKEKLRFLTTDIDFSNPNNQLGFIARNLVDTRYTTRAVLQVLEAIRKAKNMNFKIKTINGKMTSFARGKIDTGKEGQKLLRPSGIGDLESRDKDGKKSRIWHGHHAEDAYIITVLNKHYGDGKTIEKILSDPTKRDKFDTNNDQDKANTQKARDEAYYNEKYAKMFAALDEARVELNQKMEAVTFSRMVLRKITNTKLFNETLYRGIRNDDGKTMKKITSVTLIDLKKEDAAKYFEQEGKFADKVIIRKANPKMYQDLCAIYEKFKGEKYPFKSACEYFKTEFVELPYTSKSGQQLKHQVRRINIEKQDDKKVDDVVLAGGNNVNDKRNRTSFYESMEWVRIDVYKDAKGKFKIIPIDARNAKFVTTSGISQIILKEEMFAKQKSEKNIPVDAKPIHSLFKNDCLELQDGTLVYVVGHLWSQDKLEIKRLVRTKLEEEPDQWHATLNTFLNGAKVTELNTLGEIIKKVHLF